MPRSQDREELFAFEINWQTVETHNIIQSKMRPWIVKKIIEYLGEEEKTLTEFILTKLGQRAPPQVCSGGQRRVFRLACSPCAVLATSIDRSMCM